MTRVYAVKGPRGRINPNTVATTADECWAKGFNFMPETFRASYWKRWNASKAAAKKLGYRVTRVVVVDAALAPKET